MSLACSRNRKTDLCLKWTEQGGRWVERWEGLHLRLCRSWKEVWVYSQGIGKLLGLEQRNGMSLLKEEKERKRITMAAA